MWPNAIGTFNRPSKCLGIQKVCLGFKRIHRNVDKKYLKKSKIMIWGIDYFITKLKTKIDVIIRSCFNIITTYCMGCTSLMTPIRSYVKNVRAELGRYPLLIDVAIFTIKLWINILNSPEKLLFKAYQEEIKLDECGIRNWVTFVRNILESCGLSKLWEHQTIPKDVDVPKKINLVLKKTVRKYIF